MKQKSGVQKPLTKRGVLRKALRVGKINIRKNMKYSIKLVGVVIAFTMAADGLFAQTFGIKGGLNLSTVLIKNDDETLSDDFKMNPGFHIGATAEFPSDKAISFETGLFVTTKGYRINQDEMSGPETFKVEGKMNLLYLDLPLTVKAKFDVGGVKLFGVFGPYIGMGLSGKSKFTLTFNGETESGEETINWGSDENEDIFKRLDYGLTMGAGVEINSILIGANYGLGLANISNYSGDGYRVNHRVIGISVGYKFGGN